MMKNKDTINYRKQFWIDLAKSDWVKEAQDRMDEVMFRILAETEGPRNGKTKV
jgi:hypothetical protein